MPAKIGRTGTAAYLLLALVVAPTVNVFLGTAFEQFRRHRSERQPLLDDVDREEEGSGDLLLGGSPDLSWR